MQKFLEWITAPIWHLLFFRANASRQATLLWTLAVAVDKHVALVPFLEALADEAGGRWRLKLRGLADLLHSGVSIPDALDSVDGLLPPDTLLIVRSGAQAGRLGPALREAAAQFVRRSETVRVPSGSGAAYLMALASVMLFVLGFIMYWIIPKFKAIFQGFDVEMPELTLTIIRLSDLAGEYWYLVMPPAFIALAIVMTLCTELINWNIGWPAGSKLITRSFPRLKTPTVLRCLGFAVDGSRPLTSALALLASRHPDLAFRARILQVENEVLSGQTCWSSLYGAGLVTRNEASLLAAAERVGNLGWALRGTADAIERRFEHRTRLFMQFLRPVALLATGSVVGFFVIGMFLPLVKLIQTLS